MMILNVFLSFIIVTINKFTAVITLTKKLSSNLGSNPATKLIIPASEHSKL